MRHRTSRKPTKPLISSSDLKAIFKQAGYEVTSNSSALRLTKYGLSHYIYIHDAGYELPISNIKYKNPKTILDKIEQYFKVERLKDNRKNMSAIYVEQLTNILSRMGVDLSHYSNNVRAVSSTGVATINMENVDSYFQPGENITIYLNENSHRYSISDMQSLDKLDTIKKFLVEFEDELLTEQL